MATDLGRAEIDKYAVTLQSLHFAGLQKHSGIAINYRKKNKRTIQEFRDAIRELSQWVNLRSEILYSYFDYVKRVALAEFEKYPWPNMYGRYDFVQGFQAEWAESVQSRLVVVER